jgi:hypothetical protein
MASNSSQQPPPYSYHQTAFRPSSAAPLRCYNGRTSGEEGSRERELSVVMTPPKEKTSAQKLVIKNLYQNCLSRNKNEVPTYTADVY